MMCYIEVRNIRLQVTYLLHLSTLVTVEQNVNSVISQLLAMNASSDSKQLQHLLEMENREEQQLLNVAQAKYQSYQRKDVISEYCSGLRLLYAWCSVLLCTVPSHSVWYIGEVTRPVPAIWSHRLWTVLGHVLCLLKSPGLCLEGVCLPYAASGPHFIYCRHSLCLCLMQQLPLLRGLEL